MRIEHDEAVRVAESLPAGLATLHPHYVRADALRTPGTKPTFWCHREDDRVWYHGFHLCPLPGESGYDAQSPYGYGGPVANDHDPAFLARAWTAYRGWLIDEHVPAEFLRFHPLLDNAVFYGGDRHDDRTTVWIDLTIPKLLESYDVRARTAVKKAEKRGLSFHVRPFGASDVTRFTEFYHTGMRAIDAAPFYFFPETYFAAFAEWPSVWLGTCERDGEWLAAGMFLAGKTSLEYHLAATSPAGKKESATNLLLHGAALAGQAAGLERFYLGGGTDARPDNPLLFFKQGFSEKRAPFRIGTAIHDAERYEALKRAHPERWQSNSGRILFYR